MKQILTIADAARLYGVTPQTIRYRIKHGQLKMATGVCIPSWTAPKSQTFGRLHSDIMAAVNREADKLGAKA